MDGDIEARAARLRPGVLGWGHAVVGLLAAMVCVLLPSLVLMSTGGAQMAAGADGGGLDAMPKLAVPPWMALAQFVPLLIIVALVLRGARRKAVWEAGNGAARRPGEMAAVESGRFFGPGMLRALLVIGVIAVIIAVVANIFLAVRGEAPNSLAGKLGLGKGAGADLLIIAGAACIGPVAEELAFRGLVFRGVDPLGGQLHRVGRGVLLVDRSRHGRPWRGARRRPVRRPRRHGRPQPLRRGRASVDRMISPHGLAPCIAGAGGPSARRRRQAIPNW